MEWPGFFSWTMEVTMEVTMLLWDEPISFCRIITATRNTGRHPLISVYFELEWSMLADSSFAVSLALSLGNPSVW